MTGSLVKREDHGSVARLTLNQPERLNLLSEAMIHALQHELDAVGGDPAIGCVILAAEGRAFCAGHDLRELTAGRQAEDGGQAYFRQVFDLCSKMMMSIVRLRQPVIAEIHGVAVAAGCQLVASCDLAIASSEARFGVNGVNIGLFCSTPMVALSRNLPRKKAMELLVSGRLIDAAEACELGLINRSVPGDLLAGETRALAEQIAAKLAGAVRLGKRAFYDQLEMPLADAYDYTGRVMTENMMRSDTGEGIAAFLDNRPPDWSR